MNRYRNIGLVLASLISFTLACNLPGRIADQVEEQVEQRIEEQLQEALEASGSEELAEDIKELTEELSGQDLGELMENFSGDNWSREDIPLPPDAEIYTGYSGESEGDFVLLETSMAIDEAEDWMLAKLNENGWSRGDTEVIMDQARMFDFTKGGEGLSLVMNSSSDSEGTNISITVYPLD